MNIVYILCKANNYCVYPWHHSRRTMLVHITFYCIFSRESFKEVIIRNYFGIERSKGTFNTCFYRFETCLSALFSEHRGKKCPKWCELSKED